MGVFPALLVFFFTIGCIDITSSKAARFLFDDLLHGGDFALCPACCPCYDYTKDYGPLSWSHPYHAVQCHQQNRPDCDYHLDQCKGYCLSHFTTRQKTYEPPTYPPVHVMTSVPATPMNPAPTTFAPVTSAPITSTPMASAPVGCEKIKVLDAVALNVAITLHTNFHKESLGHPDNSPSDDLVYSVCDVTTQSTLYKGSKIMRNCYNHSPYTAIKAFDVGTGEVRNLSLALSGVFLECVPNGFKMVVQSCESAPYILTITDDNHQGALAPEFYHIVET
ncbi:uncharacterized protein LOC110458646 isoform X2 [Mizuhopecten yessoensis]|uniref:Uncharacterized protein n=2 Tax=Mizuhopecten yessoensis TaxID=6573 RepID=A0A210Q677_MIZYE|nr:uncharacterized protein LOC110458646 isoform X2 [Mizuhopecten yessoensis]XP_021366119.1 uncharacterized protein LOC110458646 isoform X2 [Mizuhopecten yessoensis]OWF44252.1 hypothetical protein KP79_PYT24121 [Mizuhopecten yessoensis]